MRIRLTSDDGPNKIVSKVVPLATEKSKSGSVLVKFYNWAMGRLGFSVTETIAEKKSRTKAAFRSALQKQKGAGEIGGRAGRGREESRRCDLKTGDAAGG